MRALLSVAVLLSALLPGTGSNARAEEIVVRLDLASAKSGESPPTAVWNRLHHLPAALGAGEGYALLVLVPPDVSGRPMVSVEASECVPASLPAGDGGELVSLYDGSPLETALPPGGDIGPQPPSFLASPLLHEGDAVLLPILVPTWRQSVSGWERCSRFDLRVQVDRDGSLPPARGHFLPDRLSRLAVNAGDLPKWYEPTTRGEGGADYLIVTREQFASTSKMLGPFVEFKKAQGFSPLVETLEEIDAEMEAVEPVPEEQPDILRAWLQKHYQEQGFKYLLLLGSPDPHDPLGIPMKLCYPSFGYEEVLDYPHVATDMYFADLTGNWNPDGDEMACELEDYMEIPEQPQDGGDEPGSGRDGGGRLDGVDLAPELLVGRIPHFGKQPYYGDGILERTMAYEQMAPEPWHNRVLLPSPMITFPDGGYVDGSLVSKFLVQKSLSVYGVGYTVLGEWAGNLTSSWPGQDFLDETKMPDYWNKGYGAVVWSAHGNFDLACRDVWHVDANQDGLPQQGETDEPAFINTLFHKAATDDYPPIVFQGSCLTACPEEHGNLTHTLLQHVSIANVASSRITMGLKPGQDEDWVPSPFTPGAFTLGVYFAHAAAVEKRPIAEAFHYAMGTLGLGVQPWTFKVRLEFNLYGDPSLQMPGCDGDDDCDDGNVCNGAESCLEERCRPGKPLLCKGDGKDGPCVTVQCDPEAGCVTTPTEDFGPCDDGDPCTGPDYCVTGECVTAPLLCPASENPCWGGTCDPVAGECVYAPLPDGDYCMLNGFGGTCLEGTCRLAPVEAEEELTADLQSEVSSPVDDVVPLPKPTTGCAVTEGRSTSAASVGMVALLLVLVAGHRVAASRSRTGGNLPGRSIP